MRTRPEDMHEELMKPIQHKKMSRRDEARAKFIINFRNRQKVKESFRNTVIVNLEKLKDIEDDADAQVLRNKDQNYA
jgi:hypothetical protein